MKAKYFLLYYFLIILIGCSTDKSSNPSNINLDSSAEPYSPVVVIIEGLNEGSYYDINFSEGTIQGYAANDSQLVYVMPEWAQGSYKGHIVINDLDYDLNVDVKSLDYNSNKIYTNSLIENLVQNLGDNDPSLKTALAKYNSLSDEDKKIADAVVVGFTSLFSNVENAISDYENATNPNLSKRASQVALDLQNQCYYQGVTVNGAFKCALSFTVKILVGIELLGAAGPALTIGTLAATVIAVDAGLSIVTRKKSYLLEKAYDVVNDVLSKEVKPLENAKENFSILEKFERDLDFNNLSNGARVSPLHAKYIYEGDSIYEFIIENIPWRTLQESDQNDDSTPLYSTFISLYSKIKNFVKMEFDLEFPDYNNKVSILPIDDQFDFDINILGQNLEAIKLSHTGNSWNYKFTQNPRGNSLFENGTMYLSYKYADKEFSKTQNQVEITWPDKNCIPVELIIDGYVQCELNSAENEHVIGRWTITTEVGADLSYLKEFDNDFEISDDLHTAKIARTIETYSGGNNGVELDKYRQSTCFAPKVEAPADMVEISNSSRVLNSETIIKVPDQCGNSHYSEAHPITVTDYVFQLDYTSSSTISSSSESGICNTGIYSALGGTLCNEVVVEMANPSDADCAAYFEWAGWQSAITPKAGQCNTTAICVLNSWESWNGGKEYIVSDPNGFLCP